MSGAVGLLDELLEEAQTASIKEELTEESEATLSEADVSNLSAKEDLRKKRIINDLISSKVKDTGKNRGLREAYAERLYGFMCLYMFGVFFLLVMTGIDNNGFHLGDTVIVTLLGTTTATVIGVFNFVARYLYHRN